MLFKPKTIDEASVQAQYLEGDKQSNSSGMHKQTKPQEKQRKGKKKKWTDKKIVAVTQEATPSIKQCKACEKKGHTKEDC
jgi:hypothetical protein